MRVGPRTHSEALKGVSLRQRIVEEGGDKAGDEAEQKARKTLTKQQRELRAQIEELAAQLQQREPTADDVEEVGTTAQIMSLCAAPDGWLDIEEALQCWLQPVRDAAQERAAELLLSGGGGGGAQTQRTLVTSGEQEADAAARRARRPSRSGSCARRVAAPPTTRR